MSSRNLMLCFLVGVATAVATAQEGWMSPPPVFPSVSAEDLNKVSREFPEEFIAPVSIVFVAFEQRQQDDINTWLPVAEEMIEEDARIGVFEFPVIRSMGPVRRGFINGGMRFALQADEVRARTITLYLDKEPFKSALEIDTETVIHTFLVTNDGLARWRITGPRTDEAEERLRSAVEELLESR